MPVALVTVIPVMYLTLTTTLSEGSIAICILEKRKQRRREVQSLAQVTQLIRGGAGTGPGQTAWLQRPCLSPQHYGASESKILRHHPFADRKLQARRFEFLARDLTARAGFEPRSGVLSKPSLEGDAQAGTDLVLILLSRSECNCAVQCDKNLGSRWS